MVHIKLKYISRTKGEYVSKRYRLQERKIPKIIRIINKTEDMRHKMDESFRYYCIIKAST